MRLAPANNTPAAGSFSPSPSPHLVELANALEALCLAALVRQQRVLLVKADERIAVGAKLLVVRLHKGPADGVKLGVHCVVEGVEAGVL